MQAEKFADAWQIFAILENAGLKDPRLYRLIGCAHERLRDNPKAASYLALIPEQADLLFSLGNTEKQNGRLEKAPEYYRQAVKLAPQQPN